MALAATMLTTSLGTSAYAATPQNLSVQTVTSTSILNAPANYEDITNKFVEVYGRSNVSSIVNQAMGSFSTEPTQRGVVTITAKVAIKILKENGTAIIRNIKRVPIIGKACGEFLERHMSGLISALEKVNDGIETAIAKFFVNIGMSESTAEIWADVVMTALGFFFNTFI